MKKMEGKTQSHRAYNRKFQIPYVEGQTSEFLFPFCLSWVL